MSVAELKEKHAAATASVNSLRERLKQRRQLLLDTDVATYTKNQGRSPVNFSATDLVCCRTLQGHTGKVKHFDRQYCAKKRVQRLLDSDDSRRGSMTLPQPSTFKS